VSIAQKFYSGGRVGPLLFCGKGFGFLSEGRRFFVRRPLRKNSHLWKKITACAGKNISLRRQQNFSARRAKIS
jgi:hypothetical protein